MVVGCLYFYACASSGMLPIQPDPSEFGLFSKSLLTKSPNRLSQT